MTTCYCGSMCTHAATHSRNSDVSKCMLLYKIVKGNAGDNPCFHVVFSSILFNTQYAIYIFIKTRE